MNAQDLILAFHGARVVEVADDHLLLRVPLHPELSVSDPPFNTLDEDPILTPPDPETVAENRKRFYDAAFERWWSHYWYKTGKVDARRAFEKRVKILAKRILPEQAVNDLIQWAKEYRLRFEGTEEWSWRSRLHPATWLNNEGWNDQPAPANGSRTKQQGVADDFKRRHGLE